MFLPFAAGRSEVADTTPGVADPRSARAFEDDVPLSVERSATASEIIYATSLSVSSAFEASRAAMN
jgi:hypothetical protein